MSQAITVDERADRVTVTFARPEKRNALGRDAVAQLHAVLDTLEQHPRFLILTGGADGVFIGGADLGELVERDADDALAGINLHLFERVARAALPTIAAIDGAALGGGAELTYACDLRIVTPRTVFGQPEAAVGIVAGAGAAWRLPALVGTGLAKDILFTGRRVDGAEALAVGLASRLVEPEDLMDEAHRLCDQLARFPTTALRCMKLLVDADRAAHPTADLLAQALLFESDEKRARMTDFLERRRVRR